MSQSPQNTSNASQDYVYGWVAISQFMSQGLSFSGREKNCCFLNLGEMPFADVSTASGLAYPDDGRAVGIVDWDADGRLDVWLANRTGPQLRFMQNRSDPNQHWLTVRPQGTTCNRDAIGARLVLYMSGDTKPLIRTLRAGEGFLCQSSKWVHFGLGDDESLDRLIVKWPGGDEQVFRDLKVDARYRLTQGAARAELVENRRGRVPLPGQPLPTGDFERGSKAIRLAGPLPMPSLDFEDAGGRTQEIASGSWTLVNLWSHTCAPCLQELAEFAAESRLVKDTGLRVLALNVDALDEAEKTKNILSRLEWPFESGRADQETLDALDIVQRIVVAQRRQMPVPTSFLLSDKHELCAIYKGRVAVADVLSDVQTLRNGSADPIAFGVPFDGKWSRQPAAAGATFMELVFEYLNAGYIDTAAELLPRLGVQQANSDAVRNSLATAHLNLGAQYAEQGRDQDALASFERAVMIEPQLAKAHFAMALIYKERRENNPTFRHLRAAVESDPALAEAQQELGMAYAGLGQAGSALRHLQVAHELRPQWIAPMNVMARILALHPDANIQDLDRALQLARSAVQQSRERDPQSLDTLGNVLAAMGKRTQAIDITEQALRLAEAKQNQRLISVLQRRLTTLREETNQ